MLCWGQLPAWLQPRFYLGMWRRWSRIVEIQVREARALLF